jgi:hypothetical protein
MAGSAKRRADRERIRHNPQYWWGRQLQEGREQGAVIDTPTPCSCWMCGNPRRYLGERTVCERRWRQKAEDDCFAGDQGPFPAEQVT